jgi:hypothetical protein
VEHGRHIRDAELHLDLAIRLPMNRHAGEYTTHKRPRTTLSLRKSVWIVLRNIHTRTEACIDVGRAKDLF